MAQHAGHTGKLGTVHFPTSCAADVQQSFDRALALLHSFEFGAATEGFQGARRGLHVRDRELGASRWPWGNPFAGGIKASPAATRTAGHRARTSGWKPDSTRARLYRGCREAVRERRHARSGARLIAYRDAMESLAAASPGTSRRRSSTRCRWPSPRRRPTRPTPLSSRPARSSRSSSPRIRIIPACRTTSFTPTTCRRWRLGARCRTPLRRARAVGTACAPHALAHVHACRWTGSESIDANLTSAATARSARRGAPRSCTRATT